MKLVTFYYEKPEYKQLYFVAADAEDATYVCGNDLRDNFQRKTFLKSKISYRADHPNVSVDGDTKILSKAELAEVVNSGGPVNQSLLKLINYQTLIEQASNEKTKVSYLKDDYFLVQPINPKPVITDVNYHFADENNVTETIIYSDGTNKVGKYVNNGYGWISLK